MQSRLALVLLAVSWLAGLLPAAAVNFDSLAIESNLLDVAPGATAMLFVTSALFGLSAYLRRSAIFSLLAAASAAIQWLPVFTISDKNPKLIADYAQLSGVDVSGSAVPANGVEFFPYSWLFAAVSLLLAVSLAAISAKRFANRRTAVLGDSFNGGATPARADESESELWQRQLLDSRVNKKDKDAR